MARVRVCVYINKRKKGRIFAPFIVLKDNKRTKIRLAKPKKFGNFALILQKLSKKFFKAKFGKKGHF